MGKHWHEVLIAADNLISAIFGGDADETVSSRLGKAQRDGNKWADRACSLLDLVDEGHCRDAIQEDEGIDDSD